MPAAERALNVSLPFNRCPRLLRLAALLACFPFAAPAFAEDVTYPGATLQTVGGEANSLAPSGSGKSNSLSGNTVTLKSGGSAVSNVYGAVNRDDSDAATNNRVIIEGGETVWVFGGFVNITSGNATATGNSVSMSNGTVTYVVMGGYAYTSNGDATASGNRVTISGGSMDGVVGGQAISSSGTATATGNIVTISGNPTIESYIDGGWKNAFGLGDVFTGNTLHLYSSGLTVGRLSSFQYLNFYLPTTMGNGGTMLTVTGTADLTDGGSRRSTVNVGIDGASTPLKAGDQVILIDASAGTLTGAPENTTADGTGMQGVTLNYEFDLTTSNNQLLATVKGQPGQPGSTLNEQTKALPEAYLAGLALMNQGSEMIDWHGMQDAASGQGVFGKIAGGSLKYDTGSHIDMSSVSLMSGFAWGTERLTWGAFFEYGNGDYDTHNAFRTGDINGGGDADYMGLGLAAKFKLTRNAYLDGERECAVCVLNKKQVVSSLTVRHWKRCPRRTTERGDGAQREQTKTPSLRA